MAGTEFSGNAQCRRATTTNSGQTITQVWSVFNGDPLQAIDDLDVPNRGDQHPTVPGLYVTGLDAFREGADLCRVTVTYSREGYDRGELEQEEIEYVMGTRQEKILIDLNGKDLSKFNDGEGLVRLRPLSCLKVTKYESFLDIVGINSFLGKVNATQFAGYDGDLKIGGPWMYLGASVRRVGKEKTQYQHHFEFADGEKLHHQEQRPKMVDKTDTDPITGTETTTKVPAKDAQGNIIFDVYITHAPVCFGGLRLSGV
ncbi:hypothetical protein HQ563_02965 [bacterium]|nr:hypothetical protein [bacterium]